MPEIVFAAETGQVGGVQVKRGEAWAADDPLVRQFPGSFTDAPYRVRRSVPVPAGDPLAPPAEHERPIERGTRRPGERRAIRRGGRAIDTQLARSEGIAEGQAANEGTPAAGPQAPESGVSW